jgi:hypothetical protein
MHFYKLDILHHGAEAANLHAGVVSPPVTNRSARIAGKESVHNALRPPTPCAPYEAISMLLACPGCHIHCITTAVPTG